jgi:hypothetical protein
MRIREIAQARVRYGYRKIRVLLNREGWEVGKYLAYRLYTEEGLTLKRMKPAGKRKVLFCGNGSEFTSQAMDLQRVRRIVQRDLSK